MNSPLDPEMNPVPPPRTMPLNEMHPPARVEATPRWISPQHLDSDSDSGGSNVAIHLREFFPVEPRPLPSPSTSPHSATVAHAAYLHSEPTYPTPSHLPSSALGNIMYPPIPLAAPRWTTAPLPPEKRSVRSQTKPKAPLQAPHDRLHTTVEYSDIENGDQLQTHLKGRLPVIDSDSDGSDDSDNAVSPLNLFSAFLF